MSAPTRYVAFLRAINVGGHVVKMNELRTLFESVPLADVETFIASGNVAFRSATTNTAALERRIEKRLHDALGYPVETFVRSAVELARIAAERPFGEIEAGQTLLVGFLSAEPTAPSRAATAALRTPVDEFHVHGRELYWLCRARQSGSQVTGPQLAKALGMPTTLRNVKTIQRLVAKYPAAPAQSSGL